MPLNAAAMGDSIADAMIGLMGSLGAEGEAKVREGCAAIAEGIVSHIVANAVVTVVVNTSTGGLQRDPVSPNAATLAPSAPVQLSGTVA